MGAPLNFSWDTVYQLARAVNPGQSRRLEEFHLYLDDVTRVQTITTAYHCVRAVCHRFTFARKLSVWRFNCAPVPLEWHPAPTTVNRTGTPWTSGIELDGGARALWMCGTAPSAEWSLKTDNIRKAVTDKWNAIDAFSDIYELNYWRSDVIDLLHDPVRMHAHACGTRAWGYPPMAAGCWINCPYCNWRLR